MYHLDVLPALVAGVIALAVFCFTFPRVFEAIDRIDTVLLYRCHWPKDVTISVEMFSLILLVVATLGLPVLCWMAIYTWLGAV